MSSYVVMYRALKFRDAVGRWHFSKGEYSASQAEELAECLEEQGYEVYVNLSTTPGAVEANMPGHDGYSLDAELDEIEGKRIDEAVLASSGNISEAALSLGIHRNTLNDRIRRHQA